MAAQRLAQTYLKRSGGAIPLAEANSLLGQVSERQGNKAEALRYYQRARDLYPHLHVYRLIVARVMRDLGDFDGAYEELDRAARDLGRSPEVEEMRRLVDASKQARRVP